MAISDVPFFFPFSLWSNLRDRLDHYGRAVAKHFGGRDFVAYVRGIVTQPDNGVGPDLLGMLDHQFVSLLPGLFAHLGECADVPAYDALQPAEKALGDRRCPYDNAPHYSLVLDNFIAFDSKGGRDGEMHGNLQIFMR
jgi:hypothetical protein